MPSFLLRLSTHAEPHHPVAHTVHGVGRVDVTDEGWVAFVDDHGRLLYLVRDDHLLSAERLTQDGEDQDADADSCAQAPEQLDGETVVQDKAATVIVLPSSCSPAQALDFATEYLKRRLAAPFTGR